MRNKNRHGFSHVFVDMLPGIKASLGHLPFPIIPVAWTPVQNP